MKALVLTVPHSGTHFIIAFLKGVLGLHGSDAMCSPESNFDFAHVHPNKDDIPSDQFEALIMTLRHPHLSIRSSNYGKNHAYIIESWRGLIREQAKYKKKFIVTLDGSVEDRFPQLMKIAEHFGKGHLRDAVKQYSE